MISDVLSDAIRAIGRYQRDMPQVYAEVADEISVVLAFMRGLGVALDSPTKQDALLKSLRRGYPEADEITAEIQAIADRAKAMMFPGN